jgi:hypothetical protein
MMQQAEQVASPFLVPACPCELDEKALPISSSHLDLIDASAFSRMKDYSASSRYFYGSRVHGFTGLLAMSQPRVQRKNDTLGTIEIIFHTMDTTKP